MQKQREGWNLAVLFWDSVGVEARGDPHHHQIVINTAAPSLHQARDDGDSNVL
jgi:hypothetical protein